MELDELRDRLARLGVNITMPSTSPVVVAAPVVPPDGADFTTSPRKIDDISEILKRCADLEVGAVELRGLQCLATAEDTAVAAQKAALAQAAVESPHAPVDTPSTALMLRRAAPTLKKRRPKSAALPPPPPWGRAMVPSGAAGRAGTVAATHCGGLCGLAALRQAEKAWAAEKAALRREAAGEHKRANALDRELSAARAQLRAHAVESKQLKSALKGRDLRLVDVEARLEALQGKQHDELKHQRHQLMALTAERDDLLALLQVTMRKLEHASEAAQRSTTAGERMTEQLKRATANEAAAVAAAHQAAEMVKVEQDSRSELKQANDLVARVAELQRTHYQNKNDLLRTLLGDKTQLTHADESLEM